MLRCILLYLLIQIGVSETTTNITLLKQQYGTSLNSSIYLDREDRVLQNSWAIEFQVKRVELATKYRMQVASHKEHNFRGIKDNAKWTECVFLHRRQIRKAEKQYYADENQCLMTITAADEEKTKTVDQVEKEMEKDKYSEVIKRLISLKLEAMGQLYLQLNKSIKDLEECLKTQLSNYLDKVRNIMETLHKCYSLTKLSKEK